MFQALWAGELDFIYLDNGATVIVIEHNLDVIRNADYVIDMGLGAEMRNVANGTPQEIQRNERSMTGKYL